MLTDKKSTSKNYYSRQGTFLYLLFKGFCYIEDLRGGKMRDPGPELKRNVYKDGQTQTCLNPYSRTDFWIIWSYTDIVGIT